MGTHDDSNSDGGEEQSRRAPTTRTQSINEVLEHRYERLHGDGEVENPTKEGQASRIPIPDPAYHNLKTQLLKNIVKHDDLARAVVELDFKPRHGDVAELPSFGRKFSVNDYAHTLLLANLFKDESPNSIAKPSGEDSGKYDDELNLSNSLPQPTLSRYQDDVVRLFQPYFSRLQDDVINFVQGTKHEELVPPRRRWPLMGQGRAISR